MRRFFGKIEEDIAIVEGEEFVHLKTVLRGKIGENIVVYDKSEYEHVCEIEKIGKNEAVCKVTQKTVCKGLPKKNIVLFQALIKRDKMEEVISKSVELGVSRIVPFESEFCTVKPNENKRERLEKLVLTACKQCERSVPMQVGDNLSFEKLVQSIREFEKQQNSVVLFANERGGEEFDFSSLKHKENIALVVGCEGGFSPKEKEILEKEATSITLGKRILRAETAALLMCGMVSVHCGN